LMATEINWAMAMRTRPRRSGRGEARGSAIISRTSNAISARERTTYRRDTQLPHTIPTCRRFCASFLSITVLHKVLLVRFPEFLFTASSQQSRPSLHSASVVRGTQYDCFENFSIGPLLKLKNVDL
jgi:hypothetical protein